MIGVLCVDSEANLDELCRQFLKRHGEFHVVCATSAEQAIEMLLGGDYDVVISAFELEGMNGIDLLRKIREENMQIPFIIHSRQGNEEVVINALNNGADFFLPKGEETEALFAELARLIKMAVAQRKSSKKLIFTQFSVDHAPVIIFWIGEDGTIIYANEAACHSLGYTREELLNMKVPEIDVTYVEERRAEHWKMLRQKGALNSTSRQIRKDGKTYPVDISSVLLVFEGREYECVYIHDITERESTEDELMAAYEQMEAAFEEAKASQQSLLQTTNELAESEYKYRTLTDSLEDIVMSIGRDFRFIHVNRAVETLSCIPASEYPGKTPEELGYPPETVRQLEAAIGEVFSTGERKRVEYQTVQDRWLDCIIVPEQTLEGDVVSAVLVGRDTTERTIAEHAIKTINAKLNILNQITRHDILNQITALSGYLEILQEDAASDPVIAGYTERLLKISQTIQGQIEFTRDYQSLGSTEPTWQNLEEVAGIAARNVIRGDISIKIKTGAVEVFADPLLEQVFFNLFDNAARHGDMIRNITVSFAEEGEAGVISIADDGCGVAEEDKERIFRRGVGSHTGFGLFLAREILDITNVEIHETGKEGEGAHFEIRVPAGGFRMVTEEH